MDVCKSNFKWSIRGFNRIYDFSFQESLVEIQGHKVYHASNFSLPLSIDENQHNIDTVENNLRRLQNQHQAKIFKNKTEKIFDEINDLNKKSIETITIFTAIISFIVGSIGVYKFIESFYQALLFILVFGVSISIFVFLIFISTKGLAKVKEYQWQIVGIYSIVLTLIAGLSWIMEFKEQSKITLQESLNIKPIENLENKNREEINIQKPSDYNLEKSSSSDSITKEV